MQILSGGRFRLGLGAGENLNEHVVGRWPQVGERHEMLSEAVEIIARLLDGEHISRRGRHFQVESAHLYGGKAKVGQLAVCFDADRDAAVQRAHEQFRWFGLGWKVNTDLPGPSSFEAATASRRL